MNNPPKHTTQNSPTCTQQNFPLAGSLHGKRRGVRWPVRLQGDDKNPSANPQKENSKTIIYYIALLLLIAFNSNAQNDLPFQQVLKTTRTSTPPQIDGILNDECWKNAATATVFIQREPDLGKLATQRTMVKILYDNNAIYVGAMMYDVSPDSVLRQLGDRDTEGNTDVFGVMFDTFDDDLNAFGFFVTAAGVQIDLKYSSNNQDYLWDAVWKSQVRINDEGWVAEFNIPFSAIRFPEKEEQVWGLNFRRKIRRIREKSFWNPVNPAVSGFVNQFGILLGLNNIQPPFRLSFTPYVTTYLQHFPANIEDKSNTSYSLTGGMDLKYGLNESFTLDMILIPDFGQVKSDNQVLNLGPFEVYFDENRPFFTEGADLFNKGGLFYSRRIGSRPINYYSVYGKLNDNETIINNPLESALINSTKVSGRTSKGLGIGVMNAITANTYATARDENGNERMLLTNPLTNYDVLVFDQTLKNNSYISFINTNVTRAKHEKNANVTGTEFELVNKKNTYAFNGSAAISQIFPKTESNIFQDVQIGHAYYLRYGKVSGNFQFNASHMIESDTYDPNDLGFLYNNNEKAYRANIKYKIFKRFWKMLNMSNNLGVSYSRLYNPDKFTDISIFMNTFTTFTNYLSINIWFDAEPMQGYDYFEPRVFGRYYIIPPNFGPGIWFSSDTRKRFALDGMVLTKKYTQGNRQDFMFSLTPGFRLNNRISFNYNYFYALKINDIGFAGFYNDTSIIFGKRKVTTISNEFTIAYIFTNKISLNTRIRHYWSKAAYNSFHELTGDGKLSDTDYLNNHDVSFNAFNVDFIFRWEFAPGSELNLVWKDIILDQDSESTRNYIENFQNTLYAPQANSFSIKLLYYLDYLYFKK